VEECACLSIFDLNRWGLLGQRRPLCCFSYEGRGSSGSVGLEVWPDHIAVSYGVVERVAGESQSLAYSIHLTTAPCNFGGERYWFLCPNIGCGRRVAKLYLCPRVPVFACRHCHDLTYESRRADRATLLLLRAGNIRTRLGGRPGFRDSFPLKPKGIHWDTYNRLREEAEEAESVASWLQYRRIAKGLKVLKPLMGLPESD